MMPWISPSSISRLMSSKATTSLVGCRYTFVSSRTEIMVSFGGVGLLTQYKH